MVASLLYYKKFTNRLLSKGFIMNPYDTCVWNKKVHGKQLTICFHVYDCKLSHMSPKVLDETIEWLRADYENIFEDGSGAMKVARGKKQKYLGMDLDFSVKGQVRISMCDYVKEIITAWDKATTSEGFTTVKRKPKTDLFKVHEDVEKLDLQMVTTFHNIVAKTLFVTKRARPDTSTSIAFLTTRFREPNRDDWRKLQHSIENLRETSEINQALWNGMLMHPLQCKLTCEDILAVGLLWVKVS